MNTKLKYSIVYNANGGIDTPKEQVKYQGNSLTLSDTTPEKTGYNFAGWSNSSTASEVMYLPGDIYDLDGNVTLYAVWKPKEYKIYYDANGGSNAPETQSKYYGKQDRQKMESCGILSIGSYLRKMALDGYCLNLDLPQLRRMAYLLQNCSNNLNQVAKRANESGQLYAADLEDLRSRLDELIAIGKQLLDKLTEL